MTNPEPTFCSGYIKILLLCSLLYVPIQITSSMQPMIEGRDVIAPDTGLTVNAVYDHLCRIGVRHPDIVIRQIILETGHLKYQPAIDANNIIGAIDVNGSLIQYESINRCLDVYREWQYRHYHGGDYYQFIDSIGYAEDSLYIAKLKTINISAYDL